ncbi:Translation factor GUF1, mitochondrial, partial [Geodia barretti]
GFAFREHGNRQTHTQVSQLSLRSVPRVHFISLCEYQRCQQSLCVSKKNYVLLQVFAGFYPMDQSEYPVLRTALEKLTLNDSSVSVFQDSSVALGQGWRLGFLGLLHMDVFRQRLEEEFDASILVTTPSVPYKGWSST